MGSSSHSITISYVLTVLWMTSSFHILHNARNKPVFHSVRQTGVGHQTTLHGPDRQVAAPGRSWLSPAASLVLLCNFPHWWSFGSFVRSLLRPQAQPTLDYYSGPVRLIRERKGIGRCVRCVLATCGKGGLSRSQQLVRYFYSTPLLDVAYCLA